MLHCMKRQLIQQIINQIIFFIVAVCLLSVKVIRQVTFPNRRRKGNLLSSLLLLFIYLNNLVSSYSWGFSINFIRHWKHYDRTVFLAKRAVIFTGCLLFFLSSFEWSYPDASQTAQENSVVQTSLNIQDKRPAKILSFAPVLLKPDARAEIQTNILSTCPVKWYQANCNNSKIYLRNCDFRI